MAALRALITPGVYAAALEDSPLIDLPVVTARAGVSAPKTARAQVFIEVLETVINSRLSKADRAAASILFAVGDWSGVSARERHYEVARLRNKHWTWERNYRKEPLTRDLLTVLRALLREEGPPGLASGSVPEQGPSGDGRGPEAQSEAEYHLRRLGRRRTAYPLDMSLEQLQSAGLIVPVKLGRYHERQASRQPGRRPSGLGDIVRSLDGGQSVLLLGEPGAGKTLAMYQLAIGCAEADMLPVPVRAREIASVLAREGWQSIRAARVVVLLDSLDEAVDAITQDRDRFTADLQELLSVGPYVVSSRVREYEELVSGGFPDPGFDVVYAIEPWTLETDFREYLSRLERADLLNEPSLYEAVVGSEDLARLVSRPLYARMLTFVGEQAARGLRDHVTLYGEYLARLSRVTEYALESQGLQQGGALALWQSAAWIIYSAGADAGEAIPLADVEQRLTGPLSQLVVRRVLDQVIERGVTGSCGDWLRAQLAGERVVFLRHAMLWAMCHVGSAWALREFSGALEADPAMRSECRGYTLYYYGDLSHDDGPPYRDDTPDMTGCSLTYRRVMAMFAREDFLAAVTPERRFIDFYTFLDILVVRGISVAEHDKTAMRKVSDSLHAAGLPATLLARLEQLAVYAGLSGQ